jgi:hypothetical protein
MIVGISGLVVNENGEPVGSAGSGKDTVADFLNRDANFTKIALADPLKRIARDVYAFTDLQLWGPSAERNKPDTRYPRPHTWRANDLNFSCACCGHVVEKRTDPTDLGAEVVPECYLTPRYALQLLGTEWGRECYPSTWVEVCVRDARDVLGGLRRRYTQARGVQADGLVFGDPISATKGVAVPDVRFKNEIEGLRTRGAKLVRVKRLGLGLGSGASLHPSERESALIPDSAFDMVIDNSGTLDELAVKAALITAL